MKRHTDRKILKLSFTPSFILNDQKLKFVEENKDFWKNVKKPIATLLEENFEKNNYTRVYSYDDFTCG